MAETNIEYAKKIALIAQDSTVYNAFQYILDLINKLSIYFYDKQNGTKKDGEPILNKSSFMLE